MQRIYSNFDHKKATQALNHFARYEGGQINKMKALKLIYFADRYHLRKYGRLITNDTYFAMNYGPVPSGVKDIAETSSFLDQNENDYSSQYIKPVDNLTLQSIKEADDSVFSETDLDALKFSWDTFGHLDQFQLFKVTHVYPEWTKHEQGLKLNSRIQMDLQDFLKDPDGSSNRCYELSEEDRAIRSEHLSEIAHIQALWS